MTRVTINSRTAVSANQALRPSAEPAPYPATVWSGDVPLADDVREAQLEVIFRLFNRVEQRDVDFLEEIGYRLPSLSVGDEVTIDGEIWTVAPVGFERVMTEHV